VTAAALPKSPATLVEPKSSTQPAPVLQGKVLGASTSSLAAFVSPLDLAAFEARIDAKIAALISPPPFPQQVAASGVPAPYGAPPSFSARIDNLDGVTITNATIIGGSISGTTGAGGSGGIGDDATTTSLFASVGHFTTGIVDALSSAAATITNLGTTELVATNATTTNLYVSGPGTDYELPLTFNAPLSRAGNAISLSTSGDWTGTLGGFSTAQAAVVSWDVPFPLRIPESVVDPVPPLRNPERLPMEREPKKPLVARRRSEVEPASCKKTAAKDAYDELRPVHGQQHPTVLPFTRRTRRRSY
jgi:hypothetical protein